MPKPQPTDAAPFYHQYINLVNTASAKEAITVYSPEILAFYTKLPESKADYAYAPGKWTLKEILQHVIDAERIFTYRALRIARNDATPLPGFDENAYAANAFASGRDFNGLKQEFTLLRNATDVFVASLDESQLQHTGTASASFITANAIVYIIYGHLLHHINVIKDRY